MAGRLGYTAGRFALELDGAFVGFAVSVSGGEPFADVIPESPVGALAAKHLGPVQYEPIVVEVDGVMETALADWVAAMLSGKGTEHSGAVLMLDYDYKEKQRLEWKSGVIDEVRLPRAAASEKSPSRVRITIRAQSSNLAPGSGAPVGNSIGGKPQKKLLPANFRWSMSGLESSCTKTSEVSGILARRGEGDSVVLDNVEFEVAMMDVAAFRSAFDALVNGGSERTAKLTFFDPTLKSELLRIDVGGVGICRVSEGRRESGAESVATARVTAYAETVAMTIPQDTVAPVAPTSAPADSVERLTTALLEAIAARTGTASRSTETIAARLLADASDALTESSTNDASARGHSAGRAWATDVARLGELEDLAGVADRDEWTALTLGDGHSLVAFLTDRGVIDAAGPAPSDLERDEFTRGLLAGATTVFREVAPLLSERRPD